MDRTGDAPEDLEKDFRLLTGFSPMSWQARLFRKSLERGITPAALDIPTGLGKTSVIALWLLARAYGAALPRRLVYIVDRRVVVDQATDVAMKLQAALEGEAKHLKDRLGLERKLPISTLRGAYADNKSWLEDPATPAIIVGTVDMIGSRLLFEGYGVSRKMRPYHAGFLGVDTLVVLDEAHLVPPFKHLLRTIEGDGALWPKDETDRALLPPFRLLPLSATQRGDAHAPFKLEESDKLDSTVARRLNAEKRLRLESLHEGVPDKLLADAAWRLATEHGPKRVVVFCNRRDKNDGGAAATAQGVKDAIEALAKGDRKTGKPKVEINQPELLVGARRVKEREDAKRELERLGFIGGRRAADKPTFLIATAAGEVGVDIDADHMVCDLVAWERMVQRLGRVNRRGEGTADVVVFDTSTMEDETRRQRLESVRNLLGELKGDASPGALRALQERVGAGQIAAASTPEPLRPALSRALVDAWSMTSLEEHTGRPEVAPWLRGWEENPRPQTTLIWRTHLPVREGQQDWPRTKCDKQDITDFFEAAPPHESEKLETETFRVMDWLQARAKPSRGKATDADEPETESDGSGAGNEQPDVTTNQKTRRLKPDDIAAFLLSSSGDYLRYFTLRDLGEPRKGAAKDNFDKLLSGRILVLDARNGGLSGGLLKADHAEAPTTVDADESWSKKAGFRVYRIKTGEGEAREDGWRFENGFDLRRDGDGAPIERLIVEHFRNSAQKEDGRSISRPQELSEHQDWARQKAERIAKRLNLSAPAADALIIGAALHDEGKRADRWQKAFKAPRDAKRCGLAGPLAKTRGPIDQAILDGYRHEFGSLPYVQNDNAFKALPEDWRDLVLHLVAAHHGQARPVIGTRGGEDAPSLLDERAREVALRFARLQKRWGPWGLAWWEALLRAADQQASRMLEDAPKEEF